MNECPQCHSIESWFFEKGDYASDPEARFNKENPDRGCCRKCKFIYSEHVLHSVSEQVLEFREEIARKE